jgi:methionyl-tRNA synthetase
MGDILRRNRTAQLIETKFTTGCDEHGQKNEKSAMDSTLSVPEYLDMRCGEFRKVFDMLYVGYDFFVRTSRPFHMEQVAYVENKLNDAGLIVKKQYVGIYCTGCEQFKKPSDLDSSGRCIDHPSLVPEELDEVNYFLRIEPYRERLVQFIKDHDDFIDPPVFRVELLNMLSEPLDDLCISRPLHRVSLGVRLPFDAEYVTYVWFDALINYLTNLGWPAEDHTAWWSTVEHLIGKDILKTHGIYWPIMLMSLGEEPPHRLSIHGHWVGSGGVKMSKTLGNVVDPVEVVDKLGADALRYYLARNMRSGNDSQISIKMIQQTYNGELANKLGNLFSRSAKFVSSRFGQRIPECGDLTAADEKVRSEALEAAQGFSRIIKMSDIPNVTRGVIAAADSMNVYFEEQAPWALFKNPDTQGRCATVLYVTLDSLRLLFEAFLQITPCAAEKALTTLRCLPISSENEAWTPRLDRLASGVELGDVDALFPRVADL